MRGPAPHPPFFSTRTRTRRDRINPPPSRPTDRVDQPADCTPIRVRAVGGGAARAQTDGYDGDEEVLGAAEQTPLPPPRSHGGGGGGGA